MKPPRPSRTLLLGIALILQLQVCPELALADDAEELVVPVTELGVIKARMGKAAIIKGTIAESRIVESSGHAVLKFEEADVAVFIRKADLDKNPGWALDALIDREVYVAGQVKLYREQLQVVIVGPSQIAISPDGFDLSKIPLPENEKKQGGSPAKKPAKVPGAIAPTKQDYPELPLKLEESSVQEVVFYLVDSGMKIKDDPYGLPVDLISPSLATVNAVVTKVEGGGPMQVAFPEPVAASKGRIQAVLDQLAESYGKWPSDCLLTIDVDFDTRGFKDDPSTLVIASLIHSLVTGKGLAGNLVLSAEVGGDGGLSGPEANAAGKVSNRQILEAISEGAGEPLRYVCADMSTDELNDLALDGEWGTLASVTVLAAPTLKEALQLIFADEGSELGQALVAFDQTQAVIKGEGAPMVKNSHVQERVIAAGKAWPKNKSAVFYLYFARNKVPRTYSLAYTHHTLEDMQMQLRYLQISNPPDPKEKFRNYETKIKEMRPKLDPELSKLLRAVSDFADEAATSVLRPKTGRSKERQDEKVKESDAELSGELAALAARIEAGGESDDE